ncbi:MAG: hypothetical protein AAGA48_39320 [Myxococcota bacterium]
MPSWGLERHLIGPLCPRDGLTTRSALRGGPLEPIEDEVQHEAELVVVIVLTEMGPDVLRHVGHVVPQTVKKLVRDPFEVPVHEVLVGHLL